MTYIYKQLSISDVTALKGLLKVFGEAFGDIDVYQSSIPSDMYLTFLLAKMHFIALVAMNGEEIIGGIAAYELEKFEQERREIYIYDLAVAASFRRQGVATRLMQELRRIAKERGAYVIYVQADYGDLPAIKLYESFGKKADVYHFDINV